MKSAYSSVHRPLAARTVLMPEGVQCAGKLMLRHMPSGSPCRRILVVMSVMKDVSGLKSAFGEWSRSEYPIDGMPRIQPSIAAPMVPEYMLLTAALEPWFIPESIRSGFRSSTAYIASFTQSPGVPFTLNLCAPSIGSYLRI